MTISLNYYHSWVGTEILGFWLLHNTGVNIAVITFQWSYEFQTPIYIIINGNNIINEIELAVSITLMYGTMEYIIYAVY